MTALNRTSVSTLILTIIKLKKMYALNKLKIENLRQFMMYVLPIISG